MMIEEEAEEDSEEDSERCEGGYRRGESGVVIRRLRSARYLVEAEAEAEDGNSPPLVGSRCGVVWDMAPGRRLNPKTGGRWRVGPTAEVEGGPKEGRQE
jgi:hypothetical protein